MGKALVGTAAAAQLFSDVPMPPNATRDEFGAKSLMAVTIEAGGRPAGRVLLINPTAPNGAPRRFSKGDLRWLEQIVRHLGPPLENVFLLRHLRARAVEAERSRISRDLHDGILQTLLSLNIQLGVLRQKTTQTPEQACAELGEPAEDGPAGKRGIAAVCHRLAALACGKRRYAGTDAGICRAFSQRAGHGSGPFHRRSQFDAAGPHLPGVVPDLQRVTTQHKKACECESRRGKTRSRRGEGLSRHRRQRPRV